MELILMRHGTTQGNLERRFIGTLDVPLLPQGAVSYTHLTLPTHRRAAVARRGDDGGG